MSNTSDTLHGWYSNKCYDCIGRVLIFKLKNSDEEVAVSVVSDTMDHKTLWDDLVYVGELGDYVKIQYA